MLTRRHFSSWVLGAALAMIVVTVWAKPQTVTDALGRKISVEVPAKRVVLGFNFEEFTAVAGADAWERVVGISKTGWAGWRSGNWSRYIEAIPNLKDMPDVGFTDDNTFSAEKVIALKPDVVILPEWSYSALGPAAEQFAAAGIPIVVVDYNAQTLAKHLASTRVLGAVMGSGARAEELAKLYEQKYNDILRRVAKAHPAKKPKVYVELGRDGADTIGNTYRDTMWGKIIDAVGGNNLANGQIAGNWGPLNPELVLAANPDYVFIAGSSWNNRPKAVRLGYASDDATARATLAPYARRAGWADLSAVKNNHVYAFDHGLCRTLFDFTAIQFIAKQLYPAQFADIDPVAELRRYHERYLPVKYSGSWMVSLKP